MGFYATTEVRDENRCSPVFRSDKSENRLIKTESLSSVPDAFKVCVENEYDYLGRRFRKTVKDDYSGGTYATTNVTTYVWDAFNIIAEMSDAGYTNWYTYGLDLSGSLQGAGGVGGALAMTRDTGTATNTYLYCFDGNGNVVNLVDASDGSIVATYEYSPFGSLIRSTGTMADDNPVRWSTKHTDDETGLVMYEFRPYSPELGRFVSRDPLFQSQGYLFLWNDAVNLVDVLGLADYETVYYEVSGPYYQLQAKGKFGGYFGLFEYRLTYTPVGKAKYDDEKKSCSKGWFSCTACWQYRSTRKQKAKFYLTDQKMHLPKWTDYQKATEEQQAAWDAFIAGLTTHEEGHHSIAKKMEGEKYFEATGDWGDALWWARQDADEKWLEKVDEEWKKRVQEDQKLQQKYEKDTNHGATQGAVLPQI